MAGAVSVSMEVAHANFVNECNGTSTAFACSMTSKIASTSAIAVTVNDQASNASEQVTVSWAASAISCTDGSAGTESEPAGGQTGVTPLNVELPLPAAAADGQCNVTVSVSLSQQQVANFSPTPFTAFLNYTPISSPTATATPTPTSTSTASGPPVRPIKGFDGKCVSDSGNSSANRAKIILWNCSSSDQAENWKFSSNELIHNGKCMNDQGNAGIRGKVILYTCNGASNEKWNVLANGEIQLQGHGGNLCLDDPRSSTKNGTQLILYSCSDAANQKWSLP